MKTTAISYQSRSRLHQQRRTAGRLIGILSLILFCALIVAVMFQLSR